jgi:predicted RNase H-like HicB family nuclease
MAMTTMHLQSLQADVVAIPNGHVARCAWKTDYAPPKHEFLAVAFRDEDDGGFSIVAARYPGVVSQGETIEEAKANISEAFIGMLEARRKRGEPLEYTQRPIVEMTPGCQRLWITVDG